MNKSPEKGAWQEVHGKDTRTLGVKAPQGGAYGAEAVLHDVRNLLVTIASLTSEVRSAMEVSPLRDGDVGVDGVIEDLGRAVDEAVILAKRLPRHCRDGGLEVLPFLTEHLSALAAHFNGGDPIYLSIGPECSECRISMDPTDLLRVLTNIVRNAAEACADRGSVQVALKQVQLNVPVPVMGGALLMDGSYVQLTITDEGTGLAPGLLNGYCSPPAPLTGAPRSPAGLGLWTVIELLGQVRGGLILRDRPAAEGPGARAELLIPNIHRA